MCYQYYSNSMCAFLDCIRDCVLITHAIQIPGIPLRICRSITHTKRIRSKSQDGVCDVRLSRSRVCRKRSFGWLHTQEGMGDVCFVYLALYNILCSSYLRFSSQTSHHASQRQGWTRFVQRPLSHNHAPGNLAQTDYGKTNILFIVIVH